MATFPERGEALTAFTEFGESLIELLERVRGTGTGDAMYKKGNILLSSAKPHGLKY